MSMETLMNIIIAKTPDETEQARNAHDADKAKRPSDSEVLANFLSQCTLINEIK